MEYLLEVRWVDPVADAVTRVLSALPDGVEQTTASLPPGTSRGFELLRVDSPAALAELVGAITACGAEVRVIGDGAS
jgi:hypothetical protein